MMNALGNVSNSHAVGLARPLDFVWLELTNQCNLTCVHCYSESSPRTGTGDILAAEHYLDLIDQIYDTGCRKIQFIGGEPTLNRSLDLFIEHCARKGFEFIEVFSNLVSLREPLIETFRKFNVAIAVSFYSAERSTHDAITLSRGSFERTVANIRRIVDARLAIRAAVIEMDHNRDQTARTIEFLEGLGVMRVGVDRVRGFGRAMVGRDSELGELCGTCAGDVLSIAPDGSVSPCIMSRRWSVGSVLETRLKEIVASERMAELRSDIMQAVTEARCRNGEQVAICDPKTCGPYSDCCPSTRSCAPCGPQSCIPCRPNG